MPVAEEIYWTTKQVAKRFNVSEETIRRYVRTQQLRAVRFGDHIRIPEDAIQEYIEKKQNKK